MPYSAHPAAVAVRAESIKSFVPVTTSWTEFFTHGGRIAFYLFAVAGVSAFFIRRLKKYWRYIHWLTYVAFTFAVIHATLLGANFQPTWMRVIGVLMIGTVFVAYILKRRMRRKMRANSGGSRSVRKEYFGS